jgi:hypothetical protein
VGDAPLRPFLLAGIDPGLASGAFVVLGREERGRDCVLAAVSLVEKASERKAALAAAGAIARSRKGRVDEDFLAADIRAHDWLHRFRIALDPIERRHGPIEAWAMESFVDQAQHAGRNIRNRWQAPFLMGLLVAELDRRGANVVNGRLAYQAANVVMRQAKGDLARLKARPRGTKRVVLLPGDEMITNDHQRAALAHARAHSAAMPRPPRREGMLLAEAA